MPDLLDCVCGARGEVFSRPFVYNSKFYTEYVAWAPECRCRDRRSMVSNYKSGAVSAWNKRQRKAAKGGKRA